MLELLNGCLLFVALIGGLGLPLTAGLPLDAGERLTLGAVAGCVVIYLAAWMIYWCGLPPPAFAALPILAGVALGLRRRALLSLLRAPDARRLAVSWLLLAGWCLGWLALVRSYSGGEWVGDWIEHYDRARFFLEHQALDTQFLHLYALPARPPLANLVTGAFLALTDTSFAQFQVFTTLLATLAFFPAALLACHFRGAEGGDAAVPLTVLLMLSPLFVQNATFAWTKLPAAFFTLAGLYFFLRAGRAPDDQRTLCTALCLAAALLTHYSAAPYVIVLALAWMLQRRADWGRAGFWRALLRPALVATGLLATWLVWSAWHYGSATFLSNTAVTDNEGLTFSQQLARRAVNLFTTLVPHPLRPAEYAFVQQASVLGWWRDYFFDLYQTNLPLAFGSGGLVALTALAWRRRGEIPAFWYWFVATSGLLSIAVTSWSDHWGTTHVGLQPIVILGLAALAAGLPTLGRGWRIWLVLGLALDFCLGIAGHFWMQHRELPMEVLARNQGRELIPLQGYTTWNNFFEKNLLHLTFLGDRGLPAWLLCVLLGGLLLIAIRRAIRHDTRSTA